MWNEGGGLLFVDPSHSISFGHYVAAVPGRVETTSNDAGKDENSKDNWESDDEGEVWWFAWSWDGGGTGSGCGDWGCIEDCACRNRKWLRRTRRLQAGYVEGLEDCWKQC